jgi:hypothetical protein
MAMRLLHAPTSLAARGFMRRRKKIQETRGSGAASSLLPFFAGGDLQNTKKHNKQFILVFLSSFSDLYLSPLFF